jgi:short-subunit dehydrogenase
MNKIALITGSSNGIGLELAGIHASKGGDMILVARSGDKLKDIKDRLEKDYNVNVYIIEKDLSVQGSAKEVYDEIKHKGFEINYLINNAGFGDYGLFSESEWSRQEQMINLNILSLVQLTWLFLPEMISRKSGRIMNIASVASFVPGPSMSVYYASKAFVLSFSEAIDNEVRANGITVTALCPGATRTGFQEASYLKGRKLFDKDKIPGGYEVALFGYESMMKGKTVAVHGFKNKLLIFFTRIAPRSVVVKATRRIQEKKY